MYWKCPQVLGVDLNRSESGRWRDAAGAHTALHLTGVTEYFAGEAPVISDWARKLLRQVDRISEARRERRVAQARIETLGR
jgi:hypothetical protein